MKTAPFKNMRGCPPCVGCPDRKQPCSDHCRKPEYLAWKAEREKVRKNRAKYDTTTNYVRDAVERNRRNV